MKKGLKKNLIIRKERFSKWVSLLYLENTLLKDYQQLFKTHFDIGDFFKFQDRGNYAFEAFMLTLNNTINSTNPFFYLNIGGISKLKLKIPFHTFYKLFPFRLYTNKLLFWGEFKFLIFKSYYSGNHLTGLEDRYIGYFPLNIFNFGGDIQAGILNCFSSRTFDLFKVKNRFSRRYVTYSSEPDYHISEFLGRGIMRLKVPGLLTFFKHLVKEYYCVQGNTRSSFSLLTSFRESELTITTLPFFKRKFKFKIFSIVKNNFISFLFHSIIFIEKAELKVVYFFIKNNLEKVESIYKIFSKLKLFYKFLNLNCIKNFYIVSYRWGFFMKFFFYDILKSVLKRFNIFIKSFFFTFLIIRLSSFNFLSFKFLGKSRETFCLLKNSVLINLFSNNTSLKFQVLNLKFKYNPYILTKKGFYNKMLSHSGSSYKYFFTFKSRFSSFFAPFSCMIFLKFFYLLFLHIFKSNFHRSITGRDFFISRIYFYKMIYFNRRWSLFLK